MSGLPLSWPVITPEVLRFQLRCDPLRQGSCITLSYNKHSSHFPCPPLTPYPSPSVSGTAPQFSSLGLNTAWDDFADSFISHYLTPGRSCVLRAKSTLPTLCLQSLAFYAYE